MRAKRIFLAGAIALGWHFSATSLHAGVIAWTGGGDGIYWTNVNNWAGNVAPGPGDEALITGVSTNTTILLGATVQVQTVQCSASLNITNGNLTLTEGSSQVTGTFTIASSQYLIVIGPGTMFAANGPANVDDGNFQISSGGLVTLPTLQNYNKNCNGAYWSVTGTNSVLDLPALTNFNGAVCNFPIVYAENGGQVLMTNLANLTGGPLGFQADGTNSIIDLSGLTNVVDPGSYVVSFEAASGGTIKMPRFTGGPLIKYSLNPGGTLPTAQITQLYELNLTGISANFSALTNVTVLSVSGVTMNFPALSNCNDGNFTVSAGANVTLPILKNYSKQCNGGNWMITDSNSVLNLPALTNFVGAACNYPTIEAEAGGQLYATNLRSVVVGPQAFQADGTNSLIDLAGLTNCSGQSPYLVTFEASSGGTLQIPGMTGGPLIGLTLNPGGSMPTAQIQELDGLTLPGVSANFNGLKTLGGQTTISGVTVNFPAVTNFDGGNITLSGGAVVTLPSVQSFVKDCYSPNWSVTGSNTVLSLPALTNITGGPCNYPVIQAEAGGQILLSNLLSVTVGPLAFEADGSDSLIDLARLTQCAGESGYLLTFEASAGGTLQMPVMPGGTLVGLTLNPGGVAPTAQLAQLGGLTLNGVTNNFNNLAILSGSSSISGVTMNFPALTNFDGGNINVSGGADVTMPALQNIVKDCYSPNWMVTGSGSVFSLPALTNLVGPVCSFPTIEAAAGGQLLATNLANILVGPLTVLANGNGSLVNLSGLFTAAGEGGYSLNFTAQNNGQLDIQNCGTMSLVAITAQTAGMIDMSKVQGISGEDCAILSEGSGSLINLSGLSAFATPNGASSLTETNGGSVLLNNDVFLLVNVSLNITGNPSLPSTVSAGPSVSLYGQPWQSYEVDWRDTRNRANAWQLYAYVPLTNAVQIIGGTPKPWQEFRVSDLVANPPVVSLMTVGANQGEVVIFATPGQTCRVESTTNLLKTNSWQSWSADISMTNSFRIFPPMSFGGGTQYFRGQQP